MVRPRSSWREDKELRRRNEARVGDFGCRSRPGLFRAGPHWSGRGGRLRGLTLAVFLNSCAKHTGFFQAFPTPGLFRENDGRSIPLRAGTVIRARALLRRSRAHEPRPANLLKPVLHSLSLFRPPLIALRSAAGLRVAKLSSSGWRAPDKSTRTGGGRGGELASGALLLSLTAQGGETAPARSQFLILGFNAGFHTDSILLSSSISRR